MSKKDCISERISQYWNVHPPHKAKGEFERGTLEWYRSISEHRYRIVPYMKEYVKFENYNGRKVLEIGCGAGTDLCEFARNGARVIGIDVTEIAIELTRKRLEVEGLQGDVLEYDGMTLPFEDDRFDLVFSWGVLHHTPYIEDLLAEAHRVLKPGGELKLMLYHKRSLLFYYSILYLRRMQQKVTGTRDELLSQFSEFRPGCPYTRAFGAKQIEEMLWYFKQVNVGVDYCVYDKTEERKLPGTHLCDIKETGIVDIDVFFQEFNTSVQNGEDLKKYGWHLLVQAFK